MRPTTRFPTFRTVPQLLLAAALMGSAGAAHASACTVDSGSVLDSGLLGSGAGCGTGTTSDAGQDVTPPASDGAATLMLQGFSYPQSWHKPHGKWDQWHDPKDCNPSVVPLPASSWLLISGAMALLAVGRRRHLPTS